MEHGLKRGMKIKKVTDAFMMILTVSRKTRETQPTADQEVESEDIAKQRNLRRGKRFDGSAASTVEYSGLRI